MKAVIIEDEEIVAKVLQNKINRIDSQIQVVDILPSLKVARKWFANNAEPDILFMDIQLSDGVSFELLDQYKLTCPIIFTTAYDDYAIRAFKVNGADYLLKPIDDEELRKAIEKSKAIIERKQPAINDFAGLIKSLAQTSAGHRYKEKFIVHIRNQWKPINTSDIACFVKETLNYIYLFNGERYMLDFSTLDEVEELVDPKQFFRVNRQHLVNIDAIQMVKPLENSKIMVKLKEPNQKFEVDMSREKAPVFKKWLDR